MADLSVIIPIYNTPIDMLRRCFASVKALEGCNFEALLIDDGSAPEIGDFCREFVKEAPAFRYIYKENGGVSSARNLGITEATGRYLTFLDADDILLAEPLKQHIPQGDGPDILVFDILLTQRGNDSVWHGFSRPSGEISREVFLNQLFTSSSISGPCAKLYSTQLLKDNLLCFDTAFVSGEDWMFVCDCALAADSIAYFAECSYRYFREDATGQSRLLRFPEKVLQNQIDRFTRKKEVVASQQWVNCNPKTILSLAAVEMIENLFNASADLLLAKQYTPQRKTMIRNAVVEGSKYLQSPAPKKTKLKLIVLTRLPIGLWFLAKLRVMYLKRGK